MNIVPIKHRNSDENNRVEFLWKDFDFVDGNSYIAEVLAQDYGMRVTEESRRDLVYHHTDAGRRLRIQSD